MAIARIPYDAAVGAEVDHTSNTAVNESAGGISGRNSIRQATIRQFHLTIGPDHADEVLAIFDTHRERWPVAVRDWGKYTYTDQLLTYTVVGGFTYAPLWRKIQPATGSRFLHRRILVPDEAETDTVVSINAVALSRANWTFTDFGIVKIANAFVPGGALITASGRDLVPVCFMGNSLTEKIDMSATYESDGFTERDSALISLPDVQLREILETELVRLMAQTDDSV